MRAIRVERTGGPEVLGVRDVPVPEPGPGQARVRVAVAGVNFIDVYHRTGLYPRELPFTPGVEGGGVVEAVGPDVGQVAVGDRVAWALAGASYQEAVVVDAARLVRVPAGIEIETATALMVQGLTAHYLTRSTYSLARHDVALVHAAAGGVGLLLIQLAKAAGATVIGTCSSDEKAELARDAGADHVVRYDRESFRDEVARITDGAGATVVYDSVGAATFRDSLASLRPRGYLVLYGQSSGPVQPIDPLDLSAGGSLFVTRPSLAHYVRDRAELEWRAGELFGAVTDGRLAVRIHDVIPLERVGAAHEMLEGRRTTGKVLLKV